MTTLQSSDSTVQDAAATTTEQIQPSTGKTAQPASAEGNGEEGKGEDEDEEGKDDEQTSEQIAWSLVLLLGHST